MIRLDNREHSIYYMLNKTTKLIKHINKLHDDGDIFETTYKEIMLEFHQEIAGLVTKLQRARKVLIDKLYTIDDVEGM